MEQFLNSRKEGKKINGTKHLYIYPFIIITYADVTGSRGIAYTQQGSLAQPSIKIDNIHSVCIYINLSLYKTMPVFRREPSCGFSNSAFLDKCVCRPSRYAHE